MYQRILVPHENTRTDRVIIDHVRQGARHCGASIVFISVADGVAARNLAQLDLRESEEMRRDRAYLIAMATHEHRGRNDLIRGSVASERRHRTHVAVRMVRELQVKGAP